MSDVTPTTIRLTDNDFKDIRLALLTREVLRSRVQTALEQATMSVIEAFTKAGLDPAKVYDFDASTGEVTERLSPEQAGNTQTTNE